MNMLSQLTSIKNIYTIISSSIQLMRKQENHSAPNTTNLVILLGNRYGLLATDFVKRMNCLLSKMLNEEKANATIGVLATMVDYTNMSKSVIEKLSERYGDKLFTAKISKSVSAANSSEEGKALTLTISKLGKEYLELGEEVERRCK